MKNVIALFELAVKEVIKHPKLLEKAAKVLPKKISHYLLYLCCCSAKTECVTIIIQHWPHQELTFNFFSNPLCALNKENESVECLAPHEYFTISKSFSYTIYTYFPSIVLGLFLHFHDQPDGHQLRLRKIDLSNILLTSRENIEHLLKLARGEYPVKHPTDYISDKEAQIYGQSKPKLLLPKHLDQPKLVVGIAIGLPGVIDMITHYRNGLSFFDLEISGCCTLSSPASSRRVLRSVKSISPCLRDLFIHDKNLCDFVEELPLSSRTHLWLTLPYTTLELSISESSESVKHRSLFSNICKSCPSLNGVAISIKLHSKHDKEILDSLAETEGFSVNSFILLSNGYQVTDHYENTRNLPKFVEKNCSNLQYFQIYGGCLTCMPSTLESLKLCTRLRVLSLSQRTNRKWENQIRIDCSPSDIFEAIGFVSSLEYFEWCEAIALRTENLVALHQTLCDCLPNLRHFHLSKFFVLLSTTDLIQRDNEPIMDLLQSVLNGKEGDESISTYRFSLNNFTFRPFMESIRSDVCFKFSTWERPHEDARLFPTVF